MVRPGNGGDGGGVYSLGTLIMISSTIRGNATGVGGYGGNGNDVFGYYGGWSGVPGGAGGGIANRGAAALCGRRALSDRDAPACGAWTDNTLPAHGTFRLPSLLPHPCATLSPEPPAAGPTHQGLWQEAHDGL